MKQNFDFLKKIELPGFEGVNAYEMLYTYFTFSSFKKRRFVFLRKIIKFLRAIFLVRYAKAGSGKKLAIIYSRSVGLRPDHFKNARSILKIMEMESCLFYPSRVLSFNFGVFSSFLLIKKWKIVLKNNGLSNATIDLICWKLFQIKTEGDYLFSKLSHYSSILTYCDVIAIDYYLTYLANKAHKQTITVQHCIFPENGYQYKHLHSNFFIANSNESYKRAKIIGIKNVSVGGWISDLFLPEIIKVKTNKCFGVILDGSYSSEDTKNKNIEMLIQSYKLCKEKNMTMIIRYHPFDLREGNVLHKSLGFDESSVQVSPSSERLYDFFEKSDFVILNRSSCIYSAINLLEPFCKFGSDNAISLECDTFTSYEELVKIVNVGYNLDKLKRIKRTFFGKNCRNTEENYRDILLEIINKKKVEEKTK